jgi:hypothetical protein
VLGESERPITPKWKNKSLWKLTKDTHNSWHNVFRVFFCFFFLQFCDINNLAKIFNFFFEKQNNSLEKPKKSKEIHNSFGQQKKGQNLWEKDFIEGVGTLSPYGNFKANNS